MAWHKGAEMGSYLQLKVWYTLAIRKAQHLQVLAFLCRQPSGLRAALALLLDCKALFSPLWLIKGEMLNRCMTRIRYPFKCIMPVKAVAQGSAASGLHRWVVVLLQVGFNIV